MEGEGSHSLFVPGGADLGFGTTCRSPSNRCPDISATGRKPLPRRSRQIARNVPSLRRPSVLATTCATPQARGEVEISGNCANPRWRKQCEALYLLALSSHLRDVVSAEDLNQHTTAWLRPPRAVERHLPLIKGSLKSPQSDSDSIIPGPNGPSLLHGALFEVCPIEEVEARQPINARHRDAELGDHTPRDCIESAAEAQACIRRERGTRRFT